MDEQWCAVPGFEGRYEVSTLGRMRSLPFMQRYILRTGEEAFRRTRTRLLAQQRINSGYLIAHLHLHGNRTAVLVHRLVALCFVVRAGETLEVNHKNGNKTDNRAENLEWVDREYNRTHALYTGLRRTAKRVRDPASGLVYPAINEAARLLHRSPKTVRRTFERVL